MKICDKKMTREFVGELFGTFMSCLINGDAKIMEGTIDGEKHFVLGVDVEGKGVLPFAIITPCLCKVKFKPETTGQIEFGMIDLPDDFQEKFQPGVH